MTTISPPSLSLPVMPFMAESNYYGSDGRLAAGPGARHGGQGKPATGPTARQAGHGRSAPEHVGQVANLPARQGGLAVGPTGGHAGHGTEHGKQSHATAAHGGHGASAAGAAAGLGGHAPGTDKSSPKALGKGFEEIFASILIKHMRQTIGENGMFGHDPGDVLGGMFDHFLSQHIAQSGGLGIGKMIEKQLAQRSANT